MLSHRIAGAYALLALSTLAAQTVPTKAEQTNAPAAPATAIVVEEIAQGEEFIEVDQAKA